MSRFGALLCAVLAGSTAALGQVEVIPQGFETTAGGASFLGPLSSSPRTYQMLIHEDQLVDLVGAELTGISWRSLLSATVPWPSADTTYDSYDIYLSASVPPADRSLTFALNVAGPQTQVRSGPLTIAMNTYPSGGSPVNEFGPAIEFTQGYTYTGGHLLVEIRHTGSGGTSRSVDAIGSSNPLYLSQVSAAWQSGYTAESGLQGNFAVTEFTFTGGGGGCYANCDQSTTEPVLNVADFSCFLSKFAAGEAYANCDQSTTEPVLNVADFSCFLTEFAAGCP